MQGDGEGKEKETFKSSNIMSFRMGKRRNLSMSTPIKPVYQRI